VIVQGTPDLAISDHDPAGNDRFESSRRRRRC
jgi:hypothetical protein